MMTRASSRLPSALDQTMREAIRVQGGERKRRLSSRSVLFAEMISDILTQEGPDALAAAIGEAIDRVAVHTDRVSIAVTGMGWLGSGVPAVERTLIDLLGGATREIALTAYSITHGSSRVWSTLERALTAGVRVTLVVNRIEDQRPETRTSLLQLVDRFPDAVTIYDFVGNVAEDGLHAKVVVVDREIALVGSPNLTLHGMVTAHELAVIVRGPSAEEIAGRIDLLLCSPLVRRFP